MDNNYLKEANEDYSDDDKTNEEGSTALTTDDNPYETYQKKNEVSDGKDSSGNR